MISFYGKLRVYARAERGTTRHFRHLTDWTLLEAGEGRFRITAWNEESRRRVNVGNPMDAWGAWAAWYRLTSRRAELPGLAAV